MSIAASSLVRARFAGAALRCVQVRALSAAAADVPKVPMFINGEFVQSSTSKFIELRNPANNDVIGLVPESTQEEMEAATAAAKAAYPAWRDTPVQQRMRVMLKYQALIREHHDELAALVTKEQGKTTPDAWGDVFRGLEVRLCHTRRTAVLTRRKACHAHALLLARTRQPPCAPVCALRGRWWSTARLCRPSSWARARSRSLRTWTPCPSASPSACARASRPSTSPP